MFAQVRERLIRWKFSSPAQQVRFVRWTLPLLLFLIVIAYEFMEHTFSRKEGFSPDFMAEVLFFGILGPMAVWWILGYISKSQERLEDAYREVQRLNAGLEQRVAERTAELARKNEALAKANAELQTLDRLKSEFVSLVSHALRAPLTNINGAIELLNSEREALSPARQEVLDVLHDESARLTQLVQNILDVSLLEAGHLTPRRGPVALRPFLSRLLRGCIPSDGSHRLIVDVPTDLPPVWVDEGHLADVVINLVDNAVKYSPDGGEIRVSARLDGGRENAVVLSIRDQGIGIPPDEQDRLFDQFYRANNAARQTASGYGLGLYFCRKLVEAQDGRIWVESSGVPGEGATFYVSLPSCPEGGGEDDPDSAD